MKFCVNLNKNLEVIRFLVMTVFCVTLYFLFLCSNLYEFLGTNYCKPERWPMGLLQLRLPLLAQTSSYATDTYEGHAFQTNGQRGHTCAVPQKQSWSRAPRCQIHPC